jgi:hypothetical protein
MAVGLPLAAAMMHNLTHHSIKHRIKSRHGLFRPYCGRDDDALEGTGRGSGGSPGIWLIYSVSLLAAFCCFSPGMKLLSPYDTLLIVSILDSYRVSQRGRWTLGAWIAPSGNSPGMKLLSPYDTLLIVSILDSYRVSQRGRWTLGARIAPSGN